MFSRIAAVAAASAALAGFASPNASADPAQDQQFLNTVRANGIGGQDGSLIAYAQEWCSGPGPYNTTIPLFQQGLFGTGVFYQIQVAASRAYCPDRIPVQINVPPSVFTY